MAVRVTLVTRGEDVERFFGAGHDWRGGRRDDEIGGTGGRVLYIPRGVWEMSWTHYTRASRLYVGDGRRVKIGFRRAKYVDKPTIGHLRFLFLSPLQLHPSGFSTVPDTCSPVLILPFFSPRLFSLARSPPPPLVHSTSRFRRR